MSMSMKDLKKELEEDFMLDDIHPEEIHTNTYHNIMDIVEEIAKNKKQIAGNHYSKHTIQPWDIIEEYNLDYWAGNVIKYVLRSKDKNGKEDLEKALHYLESMIEHYES